MLFHSSDFVLASSQRLRFDPEGAQELSIVLSVVDDSVIEGQETLFVSLTNPQPPDAVEVLGSTTIIITNNDFRELLQGYST